MNRGPAAWALEERGYVHLYNLPSPAPAQFLGASYSAQGNWGCISQTLLPQPAAPQSVAGQWVHMDPLSLPPARPDSGYSGTIPLSTKQGGGMIPERKNFHALVSGTRAERGMLDRPF